MARKWLIPVLLIVAFLQLLAVGERIYRYESVLSHGKRFLFKTAPVDPYDLFRGRYVAVSQENLKIPIEEGRAEDFPYRSVAWAQLAVGPDGFARFASISRERTGGDEVKVRVAWAGQDSESHFAALGPNLERPRKPGYFVNIEPPFDRYYMNEKSAPKAESAYRRASRDNACLAVRVADGVGVIEELLIDGMPVRQWLEKNPDGR